MKGAAATALFLLMAVVSAFAQPPSPATAFVNVHLIRMDRERIEADQTMVIRGDRIVAIGHSSVLQPPGNPKSSADTGVISCLV